MNWPSRNKFFGTLLSASRTLSSGSTLYRIGTKLRSLISFLKMFCYRQGHPDSYRDTFLVFSKEQRSETVCRNKFAYKISLKERSFDTIKPRINLSTLNTRNTPLKTRNSLKLSLWIGCLLICSLFACHDKAALTQALIAETVTQKVASHQRKKIATCKREALAEALEIADSVMIKLALSKVDTSGQGNRPLKPARPELDLPVDTTPIKPLFEDTIIRLEDTAVLLEKPKLMEKDTLLKDTIKKG